MLNQGYRNVQGGQKYGKRRAYDYYISFIKGCPNATTNLLLSTIVCVFFIDTHTLYIYMYKYYMHINNPIFWVISLC